MYYDKIWVGDNIQSLRKKSNQSTYELSEVLEISEDHLRKIESGVRGMSMELLYKMMTTFHVDANTLLDIDSDDVKVSDNSVDKLLLTLPAEEREYFKNVFINMIITVPGKRRSENV